MERQSGDMVEHDAAADSDDNEDVEETTYDEISRTINSTRFLEAVLSTVVAETFNAVDGIRLAEDDIPSDAIDKPLWLYIARFLLQEDGDLDIISKIPELKGISELVEAEQSTLLALAFVKEKRSEKGCKVRPEHEYSGTRAPHPCCQLDVDVDRCIRQIENQKDFWMVWLPDENWCTTMYRCCGRTMERFSEFCICAGINTLDGINWYPCKLSDRVYQSDDNRDRLMVRKEIHSTSSYFLSMDKKLILIAQEDPREKFPGFTAAEHNNLDLLNGPVNQGSLVILGQRDRVCWLKQ